MKLEGMADLGPGWNGYSAPAPSRAAVMTAKGYLSRSLRHLEEPFRVAPSAVGGVGITHKRKGRRVYVEFFNDGQVCALFSDGEGAPRSERVRPTHRRFGALLEEIKDYLNA